MRNFNFTKEEKAPYWEKAEKMIKESGLDLEIEYDSFGICKEGTYVYVKPKKTGKKTMNLWEQAKKLVQGFTPRKTAKPGYRTDSAYLYAYILIPWEESHVRSDS